ARHIVVDTLGFLLAVRVHAANVHDSVGALLVLTALIGRLPRLLKLWADQAYQGPLEEWVRANLGATLEIVAGMEGQIGFEPLPKRWIVERSLAWLGRNRRLSKDYEHLAICSEAMVYLASIGLLLNRLAPAR